MTEETTPVVPVQTANQAIDLTPSVGNVGISLSPETTVEIAVTDLRKASENEAKQHINTIWQNIEVWTHEKLEELIADLKKYTAPAPSETPSPATDATPTAEVATNEVVA